VEAACSFEVVRWMRSCRSLDELLDVAAWVRRHQGDFTEESLAKLRSCYAYFKAEITKANPTELVEKYGDERTTVQA
jgi:hypothetical protein